KGLLRGRKPFLSLTKTRNNRIFRSLLLAFRGLAPKPPHPLSKTRLLPHLPADASQMNALSEASLIHCLRGLGRLADPLESSKRFSKYSDRILIFDCRNSDFLFHS
ncbi:MAG: hypothetical protein WBE33_10705, partial [Planococcus citreus]